MPVLPLELVDPRFYHLDTCFCPLAEDAAIYYPGAFDDYGRSVLAGQIATLVEVSAEEAVSFSCNAVVVGRTVVLNDGAPKLARSLERLGFEARPLRLTEFIKAGGSAKCLTLRLDGEEAASWKRRAQASPCRPWARPAEPSWHSPDPTLSEPEAAPMQDLYLLRHGLAVPPRHARDRGRRPPPHPRWRAAGPPGRPGPEAAQAQARPDRDQPPAPGPQDGRDRRRRASAAPTWSRSSTNSGPAATPPRSGTGWRPGTRPA